MLLEEPHAVSFCAGVASSSTRGANNLLIDGSSDCEGANEVVSIDDDENFASVASISSASFRSRRNASGQSTEVGTAVVVAGDLGLRRHAHQLTSNDGIVSEFVRHGAPLGAGNASLGVRRGAEPSSAKIMTNMIGAATVDARVNPALSADFSLTPRAMVRSVPTPLRDISAPAAGDPCLHTSLPNTATSPHLRWPRHLLKHPCDLTADDAQTTNITIAPRPSEVLSIDITESQPDPAVSEQPMGLDVERPPTQPEDSDIQSFLQIMQDLQNSEALSPLGGVAGEHRAMSTSPPVVIGSQSDGAIAERFLSPRSPRPQAAQSSDFEIAAVLQLEEDLQAGASPSSTRSGTPTPRGVTMSPLDAAPSRAVESLAPVIRSIEAQIAAVNPLSVRESRRRQRSRSPVFPIRHASSRAAQGTQVENDLALARLVQLDGEFAVENANVLHAASDEGGRREDGRPSGSRAGRSRNDLERRLAHNDSDFTSDDYEMLLELDNRTNAHRDRRVKLQVEALLTRLPVHFVTTGSAPQQCNVCLEEICGGAEVRTLPCMHTFHRACIDRWLMTMAASPRCPIDQAPVEL